MELFPTEEQEGKVRLVYGALFGLFGLLELFVIVSAQRRNSAMKRSGERTRHYGKRVSVRLGIR